MPMCAYDGVTVAMVAKKKHHNADTRDKMT
jgi:hypothetical protein